MTTVNMKYENFNYLSDVASLLLTGVVIYMAMKAALAWAWRLSETKEKKRKLEEKTKQKPKKLGVGVKQTVFLNLLWTVQWMV